MNRSPVKLVPGAPESRESNQVQCLHAGRQSPEQRFFRRYLMLRIVRVNQQNVDDAIAGLGLDHIQISFDMAGQPRCLFIAELAAAGYDLGRGKSVPLLSHDLDDEGALPLAGEYVFVIRYCDPKHTSALRASPNARNTNWNVPTALI